MGRTGPVVTPTLSPARPASGPPAAADRPRRAVDVSPCHGLDQRCVSAPSEGLGAPFPPRPAPPRPSPSAPRFPLHPPFSSRVVPPPSNAFHWIWPERTLSTKCSLLHPVGGQFTPVSATKSPLPPSPHQTQSPVQPLHRVRTPPCRRSLEGASHAMHLTRDMRRIANGRRSGIASAAVPVTPVSCHVLGQVMHPHSNRLFRGLMSLGHRPNRSADVIPHVWRCHCRPERTLSESVHRLRPVGRRFTPVPATRSRLRPLCHQTPTPVHPPHCADVLRFGGAHRGAHVCGVL